MFYCIQNPGVPNFFEKFDRFKQDLGTPLMFFLMVNITLCCTMKGREFFYLNNIKEREMLTIPPGYSLNTLNNL